jgi:hypothetical protein
MHKLSVLDTIEYNGLQRYSKGQCQCVFCLSSFPSWKELVSDTCSRWSCSFLPSARHAAPRLDLVASTASWGCMYCGFAQEFATQSQVLAHVAEHHRYRACSQPVFFSEEEFERHLVVEHAAQPPLTSLRRQCRKDMPHAPHL